MATTVQTFGATVAGTHQSHADGFGEDRWRSARVRGHTLLVVADGVGACKQGALGAELACASVRKALRLWPGCASGIDVVWLLRLIEALWRLQLASTPPSTCATTCMFAVHEADGHILAAGLGDGLCLIRSGTALIRRGGRGRDEFNDQTLALGAPHRLDDWWVFSEGPGHRRAVLLATDGVSDDLDPDRYESLTSWLFDEVATLTAARRGRLLKAELNRWPVPGRNDDRTLAALVEREAECAR